jgi:chromosome segregation ATPase
MAEEIVGLKIQVDGSDVGKSVGSLKQQLREAQNEVTALSDKFGATSKEAINAAKRASELKDAIGDAKALTDAFNPDAKFKALTASLSGVAGGFAAAQGAIALFGAESEEVEKTLLKVQSALALSQGLQSIGESIDSFKQLGAVIQSTTAFQKINNTVTAITAAVMKALGVAVETTSTSFRVLKGAIAATGIGLLVVAVGELVNAFQNYTTAAEKAKKAQDDLNKSISDSAKVGLEAELQFLDNQKQLDIAKAKNREASEKEIFDIEQKYRKLKAQSQIRYWQEIKNTDKEGAANALKEVEKINIEGSVAALDFQTKQKEKAKAAAKAKADKDAEDAKKEAERLAEGREKARKAGEAFDLLVLEKNEKKKEQEARDEEKRIEDENKQLEQLFELEEKKQQVVIDSKNNIIKAEKELTAYQLAQFEARKAIELAYVDVVVNAAGLLKQVAGKNKTLQAAAIIAENAAGIGRIVINTQVANAKAIAANPLALGQPFVTLNTISAGIGIASSILATRKALSELGGGGSAGTAPSLGVGGSAPLAPSEPTAQLTQLNQASINQMGSAAGRAYVVESDITNQQEKIIRINRAARLG